MTAFKVGDRVKICRKITDPYNQAPTWDDSWYSAGMDKCVGKKGIITRISGTSYYIEVPDFEDEEYNYPIEALCYTDSKEEINYKIRQMKDRWKRFQYNKQLKGAF